MRIDKIQRTDDEQTSRLAVTIEFTRYDFPEEPRDKDAAKEWRELLIKIGTIWEEMK